jgi:antitoxin component of MazEF toxin-antitoxin module
MMERKKVKVFELKTGSDGFLTIPRELLEFIGVPPENKVFVVALQNQKIEIRRIKTPEELMGALPLTVEEESDYEDCSEKENIDNTKQGNFTISITVQNG